MPRVKRGVTARARHKKVLALAKGYRGRRGNVYRIAKQAVMKAGQYAYRDRRNKKRVFRRLWIARINAATRALGLTYSQLHLMSEHSDIAVDGQGGDVYVSIDYQSPDGDVFMSQAKTPSECHSASSTMKHQ